jgi:hypothetical protein
MWSLHTIGKALVSLLDGLLLCEPVEVSMVMQGYHVGHTCALWVVQAPRVQVQVQLY